MMPIVSEGVSRIMAERFRQLYDEGYTPAHDIDRHSDGMLGVAAACYALPDALRVRIQPGSATPMIWPFNPREWKPSPEDRIRELEKAGALIAAEIDRLTTIQKSRETSGVQLPLR